MNFSEEDRQRRAELKKQAERIFGTAPTAVDLAWTLLVLMTIDQLNVSVAGSCKRGMHNATHASEADA